MDKAYSTNMTKYFWAVIASAIYILLLVWFAHVDVVFDCCRNDIVTISGISSQVVCKHAHMLSLLTNFGLLAMLFIDLLMANKYEGVICITLLNLVGVSAMIGVFWCSVGYAPNAANTIGGLGSHDGCIASLIVFIITLLCLKYIAIKPSDK